jgi:hypothetical protein
VCDEDDREAEAGEVVKPYEHVVHHESAVQIEVPPWVGASVLTGLVLGLVVAVVILRRLKRRGQPPPLRRP